MEETSFVLHRPFTDEQLQEAVKSIDPPIAEVFWCYRDIFDPYGMGQCRVGQTGRDYFVRAPANGLWIWFGDLPDYLRTVLWDKFEAQLAFPADLTVEVDAPPCVGDD